MKKRFNIVKQKSVNFKYIIMNNENLSLWNQVSETNPLHTKTVNKGSYVFTAINAQYQIQQATEMWGSYGHTWGIEDLNLKVIENLDKGQQLAIGRAVFFYPVNNERVSFIIGSSIMLQEYSNKWKSLLIDSEFLKKLETDITTKALSKLGFSADVFLGRYDDNKYVNDLLAKFKDDAPPPPPPPKTKKAITQQMKASKDAIKRLIEMAKDGEFDRVQKNLHYWDETNVQITQKDRNDIEELVKVLSST